MIIEIALFISVVVIVDRRRDREISEMATGCAFAHCAQRPIIVRQNLAIVSRESGEYLIQAALPGMEDSESIRSHDPRGGDEKCIKLAGGRALTPAVPAEPGDEKQ